MHTRAHKAADAMDWDEAMRLIAHLYDDGAYRDGLLIAAGCFLGLRISDLLQLTWSNVLADEFVINEKKTGKERRLRVNAALRRYAALCSAALGEPGPDTFIFVAEGKDKPITRQAVHLILKKVKVRYDITSAKVFSSHTLRKTFGRRVWLNECDRGRGDQALVLLCDVFGHANVATTKRYLGIRQEEILSVYDALNA